MTKPSTKYPRNRDGMWKFIREWKTFNIEEIASELGMHITTIEAYAKALLKAGFLTSETRSKPGSAQIVSYTLVKDPGRLRPELTSTGKPVPPSGTQRMWKAMKALKTFGAKDLALTADVPKLTASSYCFALRDAGYLSVIQPGQPGPDGKTEVYSFLNKKDTGYYAPQIKRTKQVYDRNLDQVVYSEDQKEVA